MRGLNRRQVLGGAAASRKREAIAEQARVLRDRQKLHRSRAVDIFRRDRERPR